MADDPLAVGPAPNPQGTDEGRMQFPCESCGTPGTLHWTGHEWLGFCDDCWSALSAAAAGAPDEPTDEPSAEALAYIRRHYGVPARTGHRVTVDGKSGVIVGGQDARLLVDFGGQTLPCHPTWRVDYGDEAAAVGAPDEPTDDDLTELRRLHEAATPGPWELEASIVSGEYHDPPEKWTHLSWAAYPKGADPDHEWCLAGADDNEPNQAQANAELIVAMRNALPGLLAEVERLRAAALFVPGEFVAHSGDTLTWKIECDALTNRDWEALALAAVDVLPPFGGVEGVPTGGDPFARALAAHSTPGGPLLIADDVCTTGASLEEHRAGRDAIGVVAFARGPVPEWVTPLFTLRAAAPASEDDERCGQCHGQGAIDILAPSEMSTEALESGALIEGKRCPDCNGTGRASGSPPPTPAPTREQVRRELVVARARTPHDVEAQTDAVMALIARPDREQEATDG